MTLPEAQRHGRRGSYVTGCRCSQCTTANRLYAAARRGERIGGGLQPAKHGNSGYTNYGCRCDVCTKGHAQADRQWRCKRQQEES